MIRSNPGVGPIGVVALTAAALLLAACGASVAMTPAGSSPATSGRPASPGSSPLAAAGSASAPTGPAASASSETGGATSHGDIPDNAVFLTYRGASPAFSITYVEGWQVTPQAGGVAIRDKDSSETVAVVGTPPDLSAWITSTDLPGLQAQAGFTLTKQDKISIKGSLYDHLAYHLPAPPDPVTGKQVPSTVDRYYMPGPAGLAIVTLATPDGVDNVDALRLMIESFRWQ